MYLGKMIEVTREAPANLGTAMKTIIARFEDMKKDPLAILEDGVSANKVEAALATIGIALRDSAGEFRALQDVFDELGMKWQSLTRNQQAYIATVAAGSRQQSRFLAMMNNYDRTLDLITESQNSAGAAARQYATYQDSIAAAQARLTASWEKFYSKIVDNGAIKFAINSLSQMLEMLSKIPPAITAIGASLGALELQNIFKLIKNKDGGIIGAANSFKTLYNDAKIGEKTFSELIKQAPKLTKGFNLLKTALSGTGKTMAGVIESTGALIAANWKIIAIATAVSGAIYLINKALNAQRKEYEETIDKIKKYQERAINLKQNAENGNNLIETYEELNSKISLTEEEQTELNNTIKEISQIYPDAITYLDQYGNMHLQNAGKIRENIEEQEKLYEIEQKRALLQKQKLLSVDSKARKNWNEQDFSVIGYNTSAVQSYFYNKEQLENQYNMKVGLASLKGRNILQDVYNKSRDDFRAPISAALRFFDYDDLQSLVKDTNHAMDLLGLSISRLEEDASWEDLRKKLEEIETLLGKSGENSKIFADNMQKSLKRMKQELNIEEIFSNIEFSKDKNIKTAQTILASSLEDIFMDMDIDVWDSFLENNGGTPSELSKKIQELFNTVSNGNKEKVIQLFKDLSSNTITFSQFLEELIPIAEKAGNDNAIAFVDSFEEHFKNKLKEEKDNFIQYFDSIGVVADVRLEAAENLQLGQGQLYQDYTQNYLTDSNGKVLTYAATELLKIPAEQLQQFEQQVKEAVEKGDASALVDIQNQWLTTWGKIDEEVANILVNGKIVEAFQQFSKDYVTEISEAASSLFQKKDYSSMDISEGVNYYNAFDENEGNSFWNHATIDENGKLQLDYYGQIKAAQKDVNDRIQVYNDKIADAKAELATNKELTEDQKKELQDCINYWEKAAESTADVGDQVKIVVEVSEELNKTIVDYSNNLDKAVQSASENAKALQISSDAAKEYKEVIDVVEKLEDDIKKIGHVSRENMDALTAHGDFYQDFFTIDEETNIIQLNNMIDNYASAAEAIKAIARNRQEFELEMKKQEIEAEAKKAEEQAAAYDILAQVFYDYAEEIDDADEQMTEEQREQAAQRYSDRLLEAKKGLESADENYNALMEACADTYKWMSTLDAKYWENIGKDGIANVIKTEIENRKIANAAAKAATGDLTKLFKDITTVDEARKQGDAFKSAADSLRKYADTLRASKDRLKIIDPTVYDKMAEKLEAAGKEGKDAFEAIAKAIEDADKALKDLDNLLKEINKDLKDINVDYNPFTDLFEAWEHEWDYYYNIKRLIAQIGTQGQYIDNIISADYASSNQKLEAQHAKIGNLVAKMAANDTYITALRAGMSQTGVELMKEFGDYYKVDPNTGQLYQTDKNLSGINQLINQRKEEIYNLQKLQNEKENDLALENSKLDALEQEKSAYESILSTIESQYDSLKDNEDITVDISELEAEKTSLKAKIEISDASIEDAKSTIRGIEDEIEEIEIDITLREQDISKLEDYVGRMEDKVSEYEEYWETLNSTIAEQQELLQELNDIRKDYIDTSISTEKQLYDAIVENYQDEINEKKKQYDYLKQLDQDYLRSIKDNISKERQIREDANKQRSYQQNQQRAQLLQMDTSGAFRSELASLNKEIESQRQDLYDDLVDKQVEALEKEIDKRHELYDKEVAALEERLAYMQENAVLLWESVNAIVAEGSDAMMAILENTTEYINSNELERMQLRNEWELNVKKTFEGTEQGVIDTLGNLIQAGNEFIIDKYPEVGEAIDSYALVFEDAKVAVDDYNSSIRNGTEVMMEIFDTFMSNWNNATNNFTGYAENWSSIIDSLIAQTDQHKAELESFYDEEGNALQDLIGSIYDYDQELQEISKEMYDDFISERQRYRDELDGLIKKIQAEISAAITSAANAIQNAANGISFSSSQPSGGSAGGNPSVVQPTEPAGPIGPSESEEKKKVGKYKAEVLYYENYEDKMAQRNEKVHSSSIGFSSYLDAEKWAGEQMQKLSFAYPNRFYRYKVTSYKQGGLANFTGPAWLDGTKSQPEAVLNAKQTRLFTSMVSSLERAAANNSNINSTLGSSYNIGDINTNINVEKLDNETDIDRVARQVENRIMKSVRNRVSLAIA